MIRSRKNNPAMMTAVNSMLVNSVPLCSLRMATAAVINAASATSLWTPAIPLAMDFPESRGSFSLRFRLCTRPVMRVRRKRSPLTAIMDAWVLIAMGSAPLRKVIEIPAVVSLGSPDPVLRTSAYESWLAKSIQTYPSLPLHLLSPVSSPMSLVLVYPLGS